MQQAIRNLYERVLSRRFGCCSRFFGLDCECPFSDVQALVMVFLMISMASVDAVEERHISGKGEAKTRLRSANSGWRLRRWKSLPGMASKSTMPFGQTEREHDDRAVRSSV
jgi:hypothetical protein